MIFGPKLAIVGSTSLTGNREAMRIIRTRIFFHRPSLVVSGCADGIDTLAEEAARELGIPFKGFPPAAQSWKYFKARNLQIAQTCDILIRIVDCNSRTYGSGWTRDRAAEMGKPTEEYVI